MKKFLCVILFIVVFASFILCELASAASVTLAWDANTEPDLDNYNIYYGSTSGNYTTTLDLKTYTSGWNPACGPIYDPSKTECCEITISGFTAGETIYFAATALDEEKNESAYSEELIHTFTGETNEKVFIPVSDPNKLKKVTP